jgi:hypothetical protein
MRQDNGYFQLDTRRVGDKMRFILIDRVNRYGYIEHVASGKIVHPKGNMNPQDNTTLVLLPDQHDGALFTFDEQDQHIRHKGGKIWHPKGGSQNPSNNTICVLHSHEHAGAKFYFGDDKGKAISPYPETPKLSGDWESIAKFVDPRESQSYTVKYKSGISQVNPSGALRIRAQDCFEKRYQEKNECFTIHLKESQSISIWQYVISISQDNCKWLFKTNIIGETESAESKPELINFVHDPKDWMIDLSMDIPNLLSELHPAAPRRSSLMHRQSSSASLSTTKETSTIFLSCKRDVLFIGSFGDQLPKGIKLSVASRSGSYLPKIEDDLHRVSVWCKEDDLLNLYSENILKDKPGNQRSKQHYLERIVCHLKKCARDGVGST